MSEDLAGVSNQLEHLLAEREANLALIEQRKAGYVLPTDIPLELIADEKTLRTQRDRLLARLAALRSLQPRDPPKEFAGRTAELQRLASRLDAPDRVVLAVQAQGGMGKTALAQKLAHDLASRFPGGALWIELGPEAGQGTALERLALWLDLDLSDTQDPVERATRVQRNLNPKARRLVVLDDLWDVDLGRWLMDEVLPSSWPALLTSRSLDLCQALADPPVERLGVLPAEEALLLFTNYLGPLNPHESAGREVVQLLEGLPLALEIAARLCDNGAADLPWLRRELARKPALGLLQLPGKQRRETSVEYSLKLSYDRLEPDVQRRYRELGAFAASPFDLPALAAVWGDDESADAEDTTRVLLRRGLLSMEPAGGGAEPVYRLHSLLHAYARALLERAGEQVLAAARHAAWYARAMAHANQEQRYYQMLPTLAQLRQAFAWALANDLPLAQDLVDNTFGLMTGFGLISEHHVWCRQALDAARAQDDQNAVARALNSLGNTLSSVATLSNENRGQRLADALAAYDEVLRFYRPDTAPLAYAGTQNNRANLLSDLATLAGEDRGQRLTGALAAYDEALRFYRPDTAPLDYAATQNNRGLLLSDLATLPGEDRGQRLADALAAYNEALRFRRPDTTPLDYAMTQNNRANLLRDLATLAGEDRGQRLVDALAAYDEALRFRRPDTAPLAYAQTQNNRANLLRDLATLAGEDRGQRLADALAAYDEALGFLRPDTAPLDYAATQNNRATLLSDLATLPGEDRLARLSDALRAAMQAVTLFAQLQHAQYYAMSQDTLRQVAAACGDDFEALWARLDAGLPPEWLVVQGDVAQEFDPDLSRALLDFLNAPSLKERRAALDANPKLLAADLDPLFNALFEKYAGDGQVLAFLQNQHNLIQACREQGIQAVFAGLTDQ